MQATCSLSADVFAGAETTLKERRSPEQKVGKRESLRAAVAVLQLFKSLLSLARPGQVQPADLSEAFVVLVTMCFSRSLASTNARAGREVRPRDDDEHACRTARTRGRSGLETRPLRRGASARVSVQVSLQQSSPTCVEVLAPAKRGDAAATTTRRRRDDDAGLAAAPEALTVAAAPHALPQGSVRIAVYVTTTRRRVVRTGR